MKKDLKRNPIDQAVAENFPEVAGRLTSETLNRYNDAFAKFILTDPGDAALIDFLNAVFADKPCQAVKGRIVAVKYQDRESLPLGMGNKICHLDLFVTTDEGISIDVEVQCYDDPFLDVRSLSYWADITRRMLRQGKDYDSAKPSLLVMLMKLGKPMFGGEEGWHAVVEPRFRETSHLFSDMLCFHFIQPEICPKISDEGKERIHWWLDYFEHRNVEGLRELARHDEVFGNIMKSEDKFLADMYRQVQYACIERDLRDSISRENLARREGEMRKAKEIAIRMFESGMPLEQIGKLIALSPEETRALLQQ